MASKVVEVAAAVVAVLAEVVRFVVEVGLEVEVDVSLALARLRNFRLSQLVGFFFFLSRCSNLVGTISGFNALTVT